MFRCRKIIITPSSKSKLKYKLIFRQNQPVLIEQAVFRKPVPSHKQDFEQVTTKKTVIKTMQTKDGKVISQHEEVKHS